jgi:predicted phage terminase large subunit-like protein
MDWLAAQPREVYQGLFPTDQDKLALKYLWRWWARPSQLPPPGNWRGWLVMTGRGWGKTRTGAEWVRMKVETGQARSIALVNDTGDDTRKVMVFGPAGLMSICPPWNRPTFSHSDQQLTWPNGAVAHLYSAEAPEKLRGPEHDLAWCDEPGKWRNLRKTDVQGATAWDNLMMGLRVGTNPQWLATSTPRPISLFRDLVKRSSVTITRGTTYENRANLSDEWFADTLTPYEGTRLGRQELEGELLWDVPGALWARALFEAEGFRCQRRHDAEDDSFARVVIAVDPAGTAHETSDETGIVVAGRGRNGRGYVLGDYSGRMRPQEWIERVVGAFYAHRADAVVAEVNMGWDLVAHSIRTYDARVPVVEVAAKRGKALRAQPVAALYEQGRVSHCASLPQLEDQMGTWNPDAEDSPDRLDACVYALTHLMLGPRPPRAF